MTGFHYEYVWRGEWLFAPNAVTNECREEFLPQRHQGTEVIYKAICVGIIGVNNEQRL